MKLFCALALVACAHASPAATPGSPDARHAARDAVQELPLGPGSAVVALERHVPTAVLRGPFLVTTINPGGSLELAIAARACDEPGLLWFGYSGGGVAVGVDHVLCALSGATGRPVQAFSGSHEAVPPAP